MRRLLISTALAALVSLTLVAPAGAITNGTPDAGRHPYVGLVGFYSSTTPSDASWLWRCSGSLISATVFLTAGHCTAPDAATGETPVRAQVWFDENIVLNPPTGYPVGGGILGTPHTYPLYNGANPGHGLSGFSYGDVGVIVLDQPVTMSQYGLLPTAGVVDTLVGGAVLDQVGYGVSYKAHVSGPPGDRWTGRRDRMDAPSVFISGHEAVADDQLKNSANFAGGKGGNCFGDSGGPILLGGTNTVVAVVSYGPNANCTGVSYETRVDLQARLDWINGFVNNAACTFTASDSAYYNGPTSSAPLYGNGPMSFTWSVKTGVVASGSWDEVAPPTTGATYFNVVASGTVSPTGDVSLHFTRTVPDSYAFDAGGTLAATSFTGWADGTLPPRLRTTQQGSWLQW